MIAIFGESLAELEEQLAALRGEQTALQGQPLATFPMQAAANGPLREKMIELKRRTTRTTGKVWEMLKAVAARTAPCTLQELAHDLRLEQAGSVHSLIAILGRPCSPKHLNLSVLEKIPGNPTRYRMSDVMRAIINELG